MKIAQVCHPGLGGSGLIAVRLARALAASGNEVHLVSTAEPAGYVPADGLRVWPTDPPDHPVFSHAPVTLAIAGKLVELVRDRGVEVVHAHFAVPWATAAALACEALGARAPAVVVTLHGSDVFGIGADPLYLPSTRSALARATLVTAVSHSLQEATRKELGLERAVEVIPNFVSHLDPPGTGRATDAPPVLAHASNFRPVKRPLDVVEVFARVRRRRPARLRLIGDGPELEAARKRAAELDVESDLELCGAVANVVEELADADLFLLPSERESFGLAALEAQAAGVPVIGSAVDGLPEVVEHGRTGLLSPVGDVEAMARSAEELLSAPERRRQMAEAARRRARELFDERRVVGQYLEAYERAREVQRELASTAA